MGKSLIQSKEKVRLEKLTACIQTLSLRWKDLWIKTRHYPKWTTNLEVGYCPLNKPTINDKRSRWRFWRRGGRWNSASYRPAEARDGKESSFDRVQRRTSCWSIPFGINPWRECCRSCNDWRWMAPSSSSVLCSWNRFPVWWRGIFPNFGIRISFELNDINKKLQKLIIDQ